MGQKESRVNGFVFLLVSCINAVRRFSNAPQLGLISCRVTDVVHLPDLWGDEMSSGKAGEEVRAFLTLCSSSLLIPTL